jgi:predicted DNA-binding protein
MARKDKYLQIRVTDEQLEKIEHIAEEQGTDKAKLIREHIDRLPNPKKNSQATCQETKIEKP